MEMENDFQRLMNSLGNHFSMHYMEILENDTCNSRGVCTSA